MSVVEPRRFVRWLCLGLAVLVWPAAGLAEEADPLAEARALMERARYAAARTELNRVLRTGGLMPEQLAETYRALAESAAAVRDPDGARDAFIRLLAVDGDYELPEGSSPLVREPFAAAEEFWQGQTRPSLRFSPLRHVEEAGDTIVIEPAVEQGPVPELAHEVVLQLRQADGSYAAHVLAEGRIELGPAERGELDRLELYLELRDEHGNNVARAGSAGDPFEIGGGAARREARGPRRPWYRQWWFWTAVGVGVTAIGLGVGIPLGRRSSDDIDACNAALGGPCDYERTLSPR